MKSKELFLVVVVSFGGAAVVYGDPLISVVPVLAAPGATAYLPIAYSSDTNTASLQFDVLYSTNFLSCGAPSGGNALSDQLIASSSPSPGVLRIDLVSFSGSPFTNGVLVYVPFTIAGDAGDHDESISLTNVQSSDANGDSVPADTTNGFLSIVLPPSISSPIVFSDGSAQVELTGTPGRYYAVSATTNLMSPQWVPLATNMFIDQPLEFTDVAAAGCDTRYYRAWVVR